MFSFALRVNKRAQAPFRLFHSDVWGLSRVTSKLGFRYIVTFAYDYSCVTWFHLMKNRSELFSLFVAFVLKLKLNLIFLFEFFTVIMVNSIFPLSSVPSCMSMVL